MMPKCFAKRSEPTLKVLLLHYGSAMTTQDLLRVGELFKERVHKTTEENLQVEITGAITIPLGLNPTDFSEVLTHIKGERSDRSPARLRRLWYYYNRGVNVIADAYQAVKNIPEYREKLRGVDSLLITTEAQFNGLGFASGRVAIMAYPTEVAWALDDPANRTDYPSDGRVVDEWLHEFFHTMGLDHASAQCFPDVPVYNDETYKASMRCCQASASKDDVLSYCRDRREAEGDKYFGLKECNLNLLKTKILPEILNGGRWEFFPDTSCP